MKCQKQKALAGYTIVEVMMFLLISSALLGSVMTVMSGKQERTRFTTSVESFERKVNDIANDVSTGFYPSAEDFSCTSSNINNNLNFGGAAEQGTNGGDATKGGCLFLGKALEFGDGFSPSNYNTYTIVGSKNGTDLATAKTQLLGTGGAPGVVDKDKILADIEVKKVVSLEDSTRNVKGVAIISDFSQTSVLDNKVNGNATRTTLFEILDPFLANAGKPSPQMHVANKGVAICLQQAAGGRKAAIILGADGGRLSTETRIDNNLPVECT